MFPPVEVSLTREIMFQLRDALLKQVDAWERALNISPRTAELRELYKKQVYNKQEESESVNVS